VATGAAGAIRLCLVLFLDTVLHPASYHHLMSCNNIGSGTLYTLIVRRYVMNYMCIYAARSQHVHLVYRMSQHVPENAVRRYGGEQECGIFAEKQRIQPAEEQPYPA